MKNTSFFKLWHLKTLNNPQNSVPGDFVHLEDIKCPEGMEKAWPFLQEYRIHFVDLKIETDYVGFVSASFNEKFGSAANDILKQRLDCEDYYGSDLAPTVVSQSKWVQQAVNYHVGIEKYLVKYLNKSNISQDLFFKPIVYCNSFICSTEVYLKAKNIFTENIAELFHEEKYNLNFADGGYGEIRKGGCLSERLWGITLSHCSKKYAPSLTNIMWRNMVQ